MIEDAEKEPEEKPKSKHGHSEISIEDQLREWKPSERSVSDDAIRLVRELM